MGWACHRPHISFPSHAELACDIGCLNVKGHEYAQGMFHLMDWGAIDPPFPTL